MHTCYNCHHIFQFCKKIYCIPCLSEQGTFTLSIFFLLPSFLKRRWSREENRKFFFSCTSLVCSQSCSSILPSDMTCFCSCPVPVCFVGLRGPVPSPMCPYTSVSWSKASFVWAAPALGQVFMGEGTNPHSPP